MEITVEISDDVVAGLKAEHQAKIDACPNEMEKAFLEIWSDKELLRAHLQTLAIFWYKKRLKVVKEEL